MKLIANEKNIRKRLIPLIFLTNQKSRQNIAQKQALLPDFRKLKIEFKKRMKTI